MKQLVLALAVALSVTACGQATPGSMNLAGTRPSAATALRSNTADAAFVEAAGKGDLAQVRALLGKGANVDAKNGNGYTGVALAAWRGHAEVLNFLIEAGANVNLASEGAKAPLYWASIDKNRVEIVNALLAAGAKVNARDSKGWSALMVAAMNNRVDTVEALIAGSADVNARTADGTTALKLAKSNFPFPRFALISVLEKAGARN